MFCLRQGSGKATAASEEDPVGARDCACLLTADSVTATHARIVCVCVHHLILNSNNYLDLWFEFTKNLIRLNPNQ